MGRLAWMSIIVAVIAILFLLSGIGIIIARNFTKEDTTGWERKPLAGPDSGVLIHSADSVGLASAGVSLRDFVADTVFINPYDRSSAPWDYGFFIRSTANDHYRIVITSNKEWVLRYQKADQSEEIDRGSIPTLDVSPTGKNRVRVIAVNTFGFLYVNEKFIAPLDLRKSQNGGDVQAASAFAPDSTQVGKQTRFENFVVWELYQRQPGATQGELAHNPDDQNIALHTLDLPFEPRDFLINVNYTNPYDTNTGSWDYGVVFRDNDKGYYALVLRSDKTWKLDWHPAGQESKRIAEGNIEDLNTSVDGTNSLSILAMGDTGLLIVNNIIQIDNLDLSQQKTGGGVQIGSGFFTGDEISGKLTRFDNLLIATNNQ
jgi:hypothetical protein